MSAEMEARRAIELRIYDLENQGHDWRYSALTLDHSYRCPRCGRRTWEPISELCRTARDIHELDLLKRDLALLDAKAAAPIARPKPDFARPTPIGDKP